MGRDRADEDSRRTKIAPRMWLGSHAGKLGGNQGRKPGTVTYFRFPPARFLLLLFRGLPIGNGRSRRPTACSSLLINPSAAKGRPVCQPRRRSDKSAAGIPCESSRAQSRPDARSFHCPASSRAVPSFSPQWAAALDQGYLRAIRQMAARIGLRSMYRIASRQCASSMALE